MPIKKTKSKRNPQDLTLRNVQAANRHFESIEKKLDKFKDRLDALEEDMNVLWDDYELRLNSKK